MPFTAGHENWIEQHILFAVVRYNQPANGKERSARNI